MSALAGRRSFLSKAHWKYLSATEKALKSDAGMPDTTEYFELISAGGGEKYHIKTSHGKYLCTEAKGDKVVADREKADKWETFTIESVGKDEYAIKTYHGKYVSASNKGTVDGDRTKVDTWETFIIKGDKPTGHSLLERRWVRIQGPQLVSISGTGKTVVGITSKGEGHQYFNGAWSQLPEKFKSIAVGFDQTIVGIDTNNKVRRLEKNKTFSEVPFAAKETPTVIAAQDYKNIIVVTKEKNVFKWTETAWAPIPGPKFVQASIGEDGAIWAITEKFEPYRLNTGGGWENIPGELDQITVRNKGEVIGNNQKDQVFFLSGTNWVRFEGAVKWLSLGTNLWGVTASGTIWTR